jgi:hypothetical protein
VRAFLGGRILSMDPSIGEPETVVVEGDRIVAAGERGILARHPGAERVDLRGRTIAPGLIDAHNHLSIAALHPVWADCTGARSLEELLARVRAQAVREPEAGWVRGAGWSELEGGVAPTRRDLDSLGLGRPVVVAHYSLHQCVVDSRALDALGIGRTTPDPPGGRIERGPDGEPTGLLLERAWSAAHARSMAAYRDRARWAELFAVRGRALLRDGITAVHDAACGAEAEAVYGAMRRAGTLPISVLVMPHDEAILAGVPSARLDGPPTGEGDAWLRVGPVKLFADGGTQPAIDVALAGQPMVFGMAFPGVGEGVLAAAQRGFRVSVHAIGNVGLANALAAFRDAARMRGRRDDDPRFRVEHACLASPAQMREMAALGVVGVVQPGFLEHLGRMAQQFPPPDRERWLPFGEMQAAGVRLAASSDDPCAFHEPLRIAACGATRATGAGPPLGPEQALPYEEWLRAYTLGAAIAGGQEDERGSLTPGKRADLVVLDGALGGASPPRVAQTWVAGRLAFDAAAAPHPEGEGGRA